ENAAPVVSVLSAEAGQSAVSAKCEANKVRPSSSSTQNPSDAPAREGSSDHFRKIPAISSSGASAGRPGARGIGSRRPSDRRSHPSHAARAQPATSRARNRKREKADDSRITGGSLFPRPPKWKEAKRTARHHLPMNRGSPVRAREDGPLHALSHGPV